MQQKRRRRLVDAALDGAGVVPHAHAALAQRVQQAEAKGDLLQRALRDRADENGVRQLAVEAGNVDAALELRIERAARQRAYDDVGPAHAQRLGETPHMPVAALLLEEERNPQAGR